MRRLTGCLSVIFLLLYGAFCISWASELEKPVIYLYPEIESDIRVTLDIDGAIFKSEPAYGTGWYVRAKSNGTINNEYDYLFYEAVLRKAPVFIPGSWVVKREDLQPWFDQHLLELGLNPFEAQQFKEYWLNRLTGAPYYEIALVDRAFLDENVKLVIVPQPQTVIRLLFFFIPLDEAKLSLAPKPFEPAARKGFTVVEWGGLVGENPQRLR